MSTDAGLLPTQQDSLEKKVELAWLAAFYSGKLTERQRQMLAMHCEEDMSLSEIAQETGVSRQAVHETLSRAASKLWELEASLHMAERFRRLQDGLYTCRSLLTENRVAEARVLLDRLIQDEQKAG